jgi:dTDP-4-dehydrorhamnose reductase
VKPVILLLGRSGQVGSELFGRLQAIGEVIAPSHQELDLRDLENTGRLIRSLRPDIIVNAAAYTAVDAAETDEPSAHTLNAEVPRVLAEEAMKYGAALVHYSTDYVFDGAKDLPYNESDPANPLNNYGKTKLAGERGIRSTNVSHLIFRTSWVYATHGKNFLRTILRLATERKELTIVSDQIGAPTSASEIAHSTATILKDVLASENPRANFGDASGTYHMTAGGSTTWFEFASVILEFAATAPTTLRWLAEAMGNRPMITNRVIPVSSAAFGSLVRRPVHSLLSNNKLNQKFGIRLSDWRVELQRYFSGG